MADWPTELVFRTSNTEAVRVRPDRRNGVRDVASEVFAAFTGLAARGPSAGVLWRGQADASWRLDSSLGRTKGIKADKRARDWEKDMITLAKSAGIDLCQHLSDLEVLARLRHHGAATRLIDVSADPLISLWFACSEAPKQDGLLLALDQGAFPSVREPWLTSYDDALPGSSPRQHFTVGPMDARIAAQRGSFVFASSMHYGHHSEISIDVPTSWSEQKLAKVCDGGAWSGSRGRPVELFPTVVGILIPSYVKEFLLRVLRDSFGIHRTALFPDFDGLGREFA